MTDTVSGHTLTDPYRWLEDQKSPETRAWINSQMQYTEQYLSQVKVRPEIVKRLTELEHVEAVGIPAERQGTYFYTKRLPDENQASIYIRKGLHGTDERLIDATKLSADQNTSVGIADISKDGSLLVYGVREGGADEETVHLLERVSTDRASVAERFEQVRASAFSAPEAETLGSLLRELENMALRALSGLLRHADVETVHKAIGQADAGWVHELVLNRACETLRGERG